MGSELANRTPLPELVRDARLEATIENHLTTHMRQPGHRAISRYESWERKHLLGYGGNGVVWLERKVNDGDGPVELRAVKGIRVSGNQSQLSGIKYVRELEALVKFSQKKYADFFVECYGWYESRGWLHVAMEYCENGDLSEYLADVKMLPEDQTQRIASQILGAVTLMHEESFSHRDLKPANILIKRKPPEPWWVKLCDFGLSKRSEYIMGSTTVHATPGFMSPETIGPPFRGDPKTANPFYVDMWCFGETCHQILTGQATFKHRGVLHDFHLGKLPFPSEALMRVGASQEAIEFIRLLMLPTPWQRLSTDKAWEHQWIKGNTKPASGTTAPTLTFGGSITTTYDQLTQASGQLDITTTQSRPAADAHVSQMHNSAQSTESPCQQDYAQFDNINTSGGRDSDSGTLVLPGKDGHSASVACTARQDDKVDGEGAASSDLSSEPASPQQPWRKRRRPLANNPLSSSDSEISCHPPPERSIRVRLKPAERPASQKRNSSTIRSEDEVDIRKVRQRITNVGIGSGRLHKKQKAFSGKPDHELQSRSFSPQSRSHHRSVATQVSSDSSRNSGQYRRLPAPQQSGGSQSDESSSGGSPNAGSSEVRNLETPTAMALRKKHSAMQKKHSVLRKDDLDSYGQTFLARACARGEYEGVRLGFTQSPGDLNFPDYAGNTPLQIAAINGCEDIVELLIEAGCNLDSVNYDRETPLLDAIDNGHLGVVKLLLEAGVDPSRGIAYDEEPIDRVPDDIDNAEEIRTLLEAAKESNTDRRRSPKPI